MSHYPNLSPRMIVPSLVLLVALSAACSQDAGVARDESSDTTAGHPIQWFQFELRQDGPTPEIPKQLGVAAEQFADSGGFYFLQFRGPLTDDAKKELSSEVIKGTGMMERNENCSL